MESPTSTLVGSSTDSWQSDESTLFEIEIEEHTDDVTALSRAILAGDVHQVYLLARSGMSIPETHQWVIYYACLWGLDMMQALLCCPDIDLNRTAQDENGEVRIVQESGETRIVQENVFHFVLRTPAARFRDEKSKVVMFLLCHGVSPTAPGLLADTPLHTVAGDPEGCILMEILLGSDPTSGTAFISGDRCAHINTKNESEYGYTPLLVAVLYSNIGCAKLLLENGADINIKGSDRHSALYFAVQRRCMEMVKLLLDYGAEMDTETMKIVPRAMKREIGWRLTSVLK